MASKSKTEGKLRAIAEHYVLHNNKIDAVMSAGYNYEYARARGYNLFTRDDLKQYIEEARAELRERNKVTADRVIEEMAKIAFTDFTDYGNLVTKTEEIDGQERKYRTIELKDTKELTPEQRAAIKSIRYTTSGVVLELYSKETMLTKLGETLGIFKQTIKHEGSVPIVIKDDVDD